MSQFQLNLAESELKIILESLVEMQQKISRGTHCKSIILGYPLVAD